MEHNPQAATKCVGPRLPATDIMTPSDAAMTHCPHRSIASFTLARNRASWNTTLRQQQNVWGLAFLFSCQCASGGCPASMPAQHFQNERLGREVRHIAVRSNAA